MLGIKHYHPKMYTNPSNILEDHGTKLEALIDKHIQEVWVVWEQTKHEWFNDCPVIIGFEDGQLELCAYKTNEFAVTFDQIFVSQDPSWCESDLKLHWEKNKLAEWDFILGKKMMGIEIMERSETNEANFYLASIGFHLNEGYFAVCNGLEENVMIKKREEGPNFKYTII